MTSRAQVRGISEEWVLELFPSSTWLNTWVRLANDDASFRKASAGFEGLVGLIVQPAPAGGARATFMRLTAVSGLWTDARIGTDPRLVEDCDFALAAPQPIWKLVISQQLHPLRALVQGSVRVSGQLSALLKHTEALTVMTTLAGQIDTRFDDDAGQG